MPIRDDGTCWFAAIDADDTSIDHAALSAAVAALRLPLVVCRSKSGGAHLYAFYRSPAPAAAVAARLQSYAAALRLANADGRAVEIFPKQRGPLRGDARGSWINLPYFDAVRTARPAYVDGDPADLARFVAYAHGLRQDIASLETPDPREPAESYLRDGPPCLQTLHADPIGEGARNATLYNVGVYLKLSRPDEWQEALRAYNAERVDPPLDASELDDLVRSLGRRDYMYTCAQPPIVAVCQRTLCKSRRYGISGLTQRRNEEEFPELSRLTKITTDPPRWFVTVAGTQLELTTEDLMSPARFRRVALDGLNVMVPTLRQPQWDRVVAGLLEDLTEVEAPSDAGVAGQFAVLVGDFLERRRRATTIEDMVRALPVERNGRVYFRSQDLARWLRDRGFRAYEMSEVYTRLRDMGAGHESMTVAGIAQTVWWLPLDAAPPDAAPLTVPEVGRAEF